MKHLSIKVHGRVQGVFYRAEAGEKATELGVSHIRPLVADRSEIKQFNLERAKDILKESCFTEVYNYSFVAKGAKAIEIKNSNQKER